MGVNIHEDRVISKLEEEALGRNKESFSVTYVRESLRKLSHIPYYKEKLDVFLKKHGERS